MSPRYVQSKYSTEAPKWTVHHEYPTTWAIVLQDATLLLLPKTEYVECPPPEVWVDVTDACTIINNGQWFDGLYHEGKWGDVMYAINHKNYRFRKVERVLQATAHAEGVGLPTIRTVTGWAFIVEQRRDPS